MSTPTRLRALIVSPDADLAAELAEALQQFEDVLRVVATVPGYPSALELSRILRSQLPDAIFLSFDRPDFARLVIQALEAEAEGLPVVAFDGVSNAGILRESMRAGARDFLAPPFHQDTLARTIQGLQEAVRKSPPSFGTTDRIYSFLPSKPGVGATTLALNTAAALARDPEAHVLLADLDLACGMLRFLLKLGGDYSVVDAASHAANLDESLWPQLVGHRNGVDVLDSGSMNPNAHIDADEFQALFSFARRRYSAICLDHSGNFERYSMEALEESKEIFLVCTPEVPSLQLARERLEVLAAKRLKSRVSVLLNRVGHDLACKPQQVEQVLGVPVSAVFDNDYRTISRAVEAGAWLDQETRLGRQFAAFADKLQGRERKPSGLRRWMGLLPTRSQVAHAPSPSRP